MVKGKKYEVSAGLEYVVGHLRHGYKKMDLTEGQLIEFKSLSKEEQYEWLHEAGEVVVTDWEVNDYGNMYDINIEGED